MQEHDRIRLNHMLDAARDAISFTQGRTKSHLHTDRQLVLSLVKAVEMIGEAAYHISQETKDGLPDIPWLDIVGMRHRLVHAYYDINVNILWNTVQDDLPDLIRILETVIPDETD